ncbi:Gfo/Idh/MocA family oxidoreductase [Bremerella sp. JC817]|uniref:Gfo/Idh/MocA family oxidoreductase n=1 Tax=Bremerella sp. JC817 TaxID=3231756 RepID=UPI003458479B
MSPLNRRHFLQTSAAGAGLILTGTAASGAVQGANDRVRIAVAGLNGRGKNHIDGWLGQDNVEIAYLIDPDEKVLARTVKAVQDKVDGKFKVKGVRDVREALDDPNLDAISIATPNHWHSLMTIWAAQAGKHVYVEKPMSHDVQEGRVAVEAQKKYGVVIQHGTQRRSDAGIAGLHEAIQAGKFGRLKISYGYCCKPRGGIGNKSVSQSPEQLDWNLWRGPAEVAEYHGNYHPYNWHWFWQTGNGDLNNQGTHQLDVARWAIDTDQTHPVRAMAIGGRFQWDDQGETPNTMFAMAEYPNGQYVFFNVRNVNYKGYEHQVENEYYFEDGGRIIRGVYYPKGSDKGEKVKVARGNVTPGGNWGSFISAVRANDPSMANGNVNDAHYACVLGHLMNNSYRLGEQVPFNAKAGKFGDNAEAAEHFGRLHEIMDKGVGVKDNENYTVGPTLTFDPETEKHVGDHSEAANSLLKDKNRKGFEIPEIAKV